MAEAIAGISPQVSAGGLHTCVLANDASVSCWGYNEYGQTSVPTNFGTASAVSAGNFHTCALATTGAVTCWGNNHYGQSTVPSDLGVVTQVSAADYATCALHSDGTVTCWGMPDLQTEVPAGLSSVSHIATSTFHACALKTDATVVCWGHNAYGQLNVPSDLAPVTQVSLGDRYTCVLKTDTTVQCWGYNAFGQATVPTGLTSVSQISAGYYHACVLRTDATVVCWGANDMGQSTVPSDLTSVSQVTAGANHTCALKTDGTVVCWGLNNFGQSTVPAALDLIPEQPQTITFTSVPGQAIVGATYTVAATGGGSGNSVTFSVPPTTGAVCSVSGNVVTLLRIGSCTIAADQAASPGYLSASQATQTFDVVGSQTITFTSTPPNPGVVNQTYSVAATGGPSGSSVTFSSLTTDVCSVSGALVALSHAGTCTVAADQAAGNGYLPAPRQRQEFTVVEPIAQSISFTSTPQNPVVGGSYNPIATGGASGNTVRFSSLTPTVCFVPVGSNTVNLNTRGSCTVAADQDGNSNTYYLPGHQEQVFAVYDVQTITFTSTPQNPVVGGSYNPIATGGASGNTVRFSSLTPTVCFVPVGSSTVNLNARGSCTVAADQDGNTDYLPGHQEQVFAVNATQTISFTSTPPNPPIVGGAYTVTASGGASGNPVTFGSLTPGTCGVSGAMVSFTARGTCTIAANQSGNVMYLPATQVTQTFVIDTRPEANAGSAQIGNEGSAVTFNGSGSSDADGDALTYRWDFGDGTTQNTSSATVQHIYNDNGSYVVTLMVTDAPGATSAPSTTSAVIANVAPTATFAPTSPVPEGPITLSLTSPRDAAGDLSTLQYAFDCGDGLGFSAFAPSPTFSCYAWDNGTLTVRAQVRDKDGGTSPVYTAAISVVNVAPTVTMISAPATGSVGVDYTIQYRFTDPGTRDSPWYYQPNWGDGKKLSLSVTSTQGQPITQKYRYTSPGTYTVIIKVIDKDGYTGSTSFQVTIR